MYINDGISWGVKKMFYFGANVMGRKQATGNLCLVVILALLGTMLLIPLGAQPAEASQAKSPQKAFEVDTIIDQSDADKIIITMWLTPITNQYFENIWVDFRDVIEHEDEDEDRDKGKGKGKDKKENYVVQAKAYLDSGKYLAVFSYEFKDADEELEDGLTNVYIRKKPNGKVIQTVQINLPEED